MAATESKKKLTKAELDAKSLAGTKEREAYKKRKYDVMKLEKNNQRYIIMFKSTTAGQKNSNRKEIWWKMGWNSLLIYVYVVAKRIKARPKVYPDVDYCGIKSRTGVVSINDRYIKSTVKKFGELGVKLDAEKSNAEMLVFDMGYDIAKEDLKRYETADEAAKKQLNSLITVTVAYPDIEMRLVMVMNKLKTVVHRMDGANRDVFGAEPMKMIIGAVDTYRMITWGGRSKEDGLREIGTTCVRLMSKINIIARADLADLDSCVTIGSTLAETHRLVRKYLGDEPTSAGKVLKSRIAASKVSGG